MEEQKWPLEGVEAWEAREGNECRDWYLAVSYPWWCYGQIPPGSTPETNPRRKGPWDQVYWQPVNTSARLHRIEGVAGSGRVHHEEALR